MRERGKTFAFIGIMLLAKVKALAVIKLPLNKRALRNSISKSVLRVAIQEIVCYLTDGRATFFGAQAPPLLFRMHLPQLFATAHLVKVFFSVDGSKKV